MLNRLRTLLLGLCGLGAALPLLADDVGIGISIEDGGNTGLTYHNWDFMVSGFNIGQQAQAVDVHVGLIADDGTIYEFPDWNTTLTPWLQNIQLPPGFRFPPTAVGNLAQFPGGLKPGVYHLAAALTRPGTLEILSLDTKAIRVLPVASSFVLGNVYLQKTQWYDTNGGGSSVSAGAAFQRFDTSTEVFNGDGQVFVPIDQCVLNNLEPQILENIAGIGNVSFLNAGTDIRLTPEGQTPIPLDILSYQEIIGYSANSLSDSDYVGGKNYRFTGSGGPTFPAFDISIIAPSPLDVSVPNLAQLTTIDSSTDFLMRWTGQNGIGEISALLYAVTATDPVSVSCRFSDDGEGIIPATVLTQFHNMVTNQGGATSQPQLSIGRNNFEMVSVDGGFAVQFYVSTGKIMYLDIQ